MQVSEQMRKLLAALVIVVVIVAAVLLVTPSVPKQPGVVSGQNNGVVGIATVSKQIFNNQAADASSAFFSDIGQAFNVLVACPSSFTGTIDVEWSPVGPNGPFKTILLVSYTTETGCHSIPFPGYYPNMRSTLTRAIGSMTAYYNATAGPAGGAPPAIGTNGPTSPIYCDQTLTANFANGGGWTSFTGVGPQIISPSDIVVVCKMTVSFNGATAAGTLATGFFGSVACTTPVTTWQMYTTTGTPQFLPVDLAQRVFVQGLTSPPPDFFCVNNASGATAQITVSFASVRNL